jgi:DNA-binding beta-propeller fold protein YncE
MMRSLLLLLIGCVFSPMLLSQGAATASGWLVDDFNSGALAPRWSIVAGKWNAGEQAVSVAGAGDQFGMLASQYFMRTKPYVIEATVKGVGGGVMFCAEYPNMFENAHVVYLAGTAISTGYMDFHGKYVETRVVDYIAPSGFVKLRVSVDPIKRTYAISVQGQDVVLEELRYISGYVGLFSRRAGAQFDYLQVTGEGTPEAPSFYRKSNNRQLDHLSYMAIMEDAIYISNPVVGIVQRLTSIGTYSSEIGLEGAHADPRGVCVDEDKWLYVIDGSTKSLVIYNQEGVRQTVVSENLKDPRGVAATAGVVYVLDVDGIKVFDRKGAFSGAKAAGLFKDPKNIFSAHGMLYVADYGNGQVQILDKGDFAVRKVIKDPLVGPFDVSADLQTREIYVADPAAGVVFHFNDGGDFVERIDPMTIKGFISPRAVRVRGSMIYVGDYERILGFKKGVLAIRPALKID